METELNPSEAAKNVQDVQAEPGTAPESAGKQQEAASSDPAWLPERLARAQNAAIRRLLGDLGVESPEALKASLEDYRKLRESQMTEAEKMKAALEAAQQRAQAAEASLQEMQAQMRQREVHDAIRRAAQEAKARYPDDVIAWAQTAKGNLETLLDKEGGVSPKAISSLIDEVRKARPEWFLTGGPGSPSNAGGHVPEANKADQALGRKAISRIIRSA